MSSNEEAGWHRPPRNTFCAETKLPDARAWRRYVNSLADDDLSAVVRQMVSVDKAVAARRRAS